MIVLGILFLCFLIYEIFCMIQNDQIRKEEKKKWDPYRYKKSDENLKSIRDVESKYSDDINPWQHLK